MEYGISPSHKRSIRPSPLAPRSRTVRGGKIIPPEQIPPPVPRDAVYRSMLRRWEYLINTLERFNRVFPQVFQNPSESITELQEYLNFINRIGDELTDAIENAIFPDQWRAAAYDALQGWDSFSSGEAERMLQYRMSQVAQQ